jgi:hypothetical protein
MLVEGSQPKTATKKAASWLCLLREILISITSFSPCPQLGLLVSSEMVLFEHALYHQGEKGGKSWKSKMFIVQTSGNYSQSCALLVWKKL